MGQMEIITRTERRRRWTPGERAAIMTEADRPGVTVKAVARRHDIAESLLYGWRAARRKAQAEAAEPVQFFAYGAIDGRLPSPLGVSATSALTSVAAVALRPNSPIIPEEQADLPDHNLLRHHPGARPGSIDITLRSGVRLSVDSYVNDRSLRRGLRALKAVP